MAGSESAEYQVVRNRLGSISKLSEFTVGPLATELFAKGLIDAAQHSVATNANQPALDRATGLARSVLARIENRASVFYQYASVLKTCDLENVASDLEFDTAKRKHQGSGELRGGDTAGSRAETKASANITEVHIQQPLQDEVKKLEEEFSDLTYLLLQQLKKENIIVDDLTSIISSLPGDVKLYVYDSWLKIVDQTFKNLDSLFTKLNAEVWTFLDYYLVHYIIDKLKVKELSLKMTEYIGAIQEFKERTLVMPFIECWKGHPRNIPNYEKVAIKLNDTTITLARLDNLREGLKKAFFPSLSSCAACIYYDHFDKGCFIVSLLFPNKLVKILKESIGQCSLFDEFNIIYLSIQDEIIYRKSLLPQQSVEFPIYSATMTAELLKNHLPKNKIDGVDYKSYCNKIEFILLTESDHEFNAAATYLHNPSIEGHVQDAKDTATSLQPNIVIGTFAGGPIALFQTSKEKNMSDFFETVMGIFPDAKYIISTGTGFAVQQKDMKLGDVFISSGLTVIDNYSVNIDDSMADIHIQGSHMHTIDFLQRMFCFDPSVTKKFEVTEFRAADYQISDIISGVDFSEDSRLCNKTNIIVDLNVVGGDVNGRELMELQNEGKIKGFIVIKSVTEYIDWRKNHTWKFTGAMAAVHYVEQKMMPYNYWVTSVDHYMSALESGDVVNVMVAKLIFLGPSMQGKTITRQRLTKAMENIYSSDLDKSNTGVSEQSTVIICKDMLDATALAIDNDDWTTVDVEEETQFCLNVSQTEFEDTSHSDYAEPEQVAEHSSNSHQVKERFTPEESRQSPNFSSTGSVRSEDPSSQASFEKKDYTRPTSAEITAVNLEWCKKIAGTLSKGKIPDLERLKKKLDKGYMLYMQDTGGQPELMECLPVLTIGPALYLLFCKLTSSLDETYKIGYRGPDGTTLPNQSYFTIKETLLTALASVASMSYSSTNQDTDIEQQVTNREGCVYLIGTHRDEVNTIEDINQFEFELRKVLESTFFYKKDLIKWWYEEDMPPESGLFSKDIDARLVYPLDNKFGENNEIECLRSSIHKRLNKLFANQKIPTNWLVFGIYLRQREESIVTLESCFELGLGLNMTKEVTRAALHFLHYNLGICMHFSNIPALKDIVIPNTQSIYKNLTTLIEAAFKPSKVVPRATKLFKTTGQFSIKKFKAISDFSLPLETLIVILEHLNIIAQVSSDDSEEAMFFMPCILQNASDDEIAMFEKENPIPQVLSPLFIRFDCGFIPLGVFSSMVANLMQQAIQKKAHTDITLKLKPDNLKRNHVQFWNGRDIITFIHKPEHIRIHISQQTKCDEKLYEVCPKIRNLVKNTLRSITESMLNSLYTATSEERYKSHFQTYQFAFKCYEHSKHEHLCVVSNEDMPETMNCVWDGNNTPFEMRAENLIWYGKKLSPSKLPASEAIPTIDQLRSIKWVNEQGQTQTLRILEDVCSRWTDIGDLIGLSPGRLNAIEKDRRGISADCCRDVFYDWLKQEEGRRYLVSWDELCQLLNDLKVSAVAKQIDEWRNSPQ